MTSLVQWDPPEVHVIAPTEGPAKGGTLVQIAGDHFKPGIVVRFGAVPATSVTLVSALQVSAVSPPGTGQVTIEVENLDGLTAASPNPFTYIPGEPTFSRADTNADGHVDISDAVTILSYLFGHKPVSCLDACDANDDGSLNIADAVYLLGYAFAGGAKPPAPFPECGPDPTADALECEAFPRCN